MISSFSKFGNCVDVEFDTDGNAVVSHSRLVYPPIPFTLDEWAAFIAGVKNGEFDMPAH